MSKNNLDDLMPNDEWSFGPTSINVNSETDGKAEIIKLLLDLDSFELKISSKDDSPLWAFISKRLFAGVKSKEQS